MIKDSTIARTISRAVARISRACLIAFIGISNVFATGQSQSFTLSIENVELKEVFQIVEKNSDYRFLYRSDDISGVTVGKLRVQEGTIDDVLAQCLTASLSYEKDGTLVMIRKTAVENRTQQQPAAVVRGRVTDRHGAAVVGASVVIKGSQTGTGTDRNGEFTISVANPQNAVLLFSYLGMKSVEMPVGGRTNLTVVMEEDASDIEEVVVTGYQTLSRRESASAVSVVRTEDIHMEGVTTIDKMLQGRIPGMFVMNTSGEPSATPKIRIRGNSTINGNKSPVWVVDGVILEQDVPFSASDLNSEDAEYLIGNAIAGLNPQDIETITVLKDASATAIYGVKAANGVIVLTTKKGRVGKPRISYYGDFNVNQRPSYRNLDLMDSKQRIQLSKEIFEDGLKYGDVPQNDDSYEGLIALLYDRKIDEKQFSEKVTALQKRNTDWFDILFRNSFTQSHNVNVSGGGEDTQYYFSAGYNNTPGAAIGADSKRFTSLAKVDVKVNNFINFTAKIDYSTTDNEGYNGVSPFDYAYKRSRTLTPYNEDGTYRMYQTNRVNDYKYNVLNELDNTGANTRMNDFNALLDLKIKLFVEGLSYQGTFSFHNSSSNQRTWATAASHQVARIRGYNYGEYNENDDKYINSALPYGGTLSQSHTDKRGYTVRNMLNFVRNFGEHHVNVIAGIEARSNKYKGVSVLGYGWTPDFGEMFMPVHTNKYDQNAQTGMFTPSNTNKATQVASYLASASYTYDNRYVINANVRADGANKFGSNPKYRWLPTWSVAGKWIISNERFMEDISWLSMLGIRGSYGIQGNIHDDATPYMIVQFGGRDSYSGIEYYTINRLPNPDLRWEKTKSWNAAIDFSFLNNRIRGAFDIFQKNTEDLIMNKFVATSNGREVMSINAGKMQNKGYEFFIQADIIRDRAVEWRLGVNFGRTTNKITLANEGDYSAKERVKMMLEGNFAMEGEAIGSLYSYKFAGLNDENGYPMFYAKDGSKVHFGHSDMMELVNCGSIYPNLEGGFDTQITYKKRLSLSMAFTYSLGAVRRIPVIYEKSNAFDPFTNVPTALQDRWRQPGDKTNIPKLYNSDEVSQIYKEHPEWIAKNNEAAVSDTAVYPLTMYNTSDLRTAKTDYLRLKSIAVSYSLPESFLKQLHISSAQVRFQASNLFVIAGKEWRGLDPETPQGSIPVLPIYSLGLNISF